MQCDITCGGSLKDSVYKNSPHAEDVLKEIIRQAASAVPEHELQAVSNNLFTRCQACLRAEGHFQRLLQYRGSYSVNTDSLSRVCFKWYSLDLYICVRGTRTKFWQKT
jgi:hypothetical protein